MIAKNMCSKRYCIPKLLKKTTQVFTAQIIKFLSNRYAEMCISSGDLLFLSLLIARDLEANDLSKPAPVTGEEIYRNPGVKKKTARLDINRTGLSFYPSKIEWGKKTISGSYWRFLGFHLIFHNQLIAKSSLQPKGKYIDTSRENYFVGYLLGISIFPKVLFSQSSNRQLARSRF